MCGSAEQQLTKLRWRKRSVYSFAHTRLHSLNINFSTTHWDAVSWGLSINAAMWSPCRRGETQRCSPHRTACTVHCNNVVGSDKLGSGAACVLLLCEVCLWECRPCLGAGDVDSATTTGSTSTECNRVNMSGEIEWVCETSRGRYPCHIFVDGVFDTHTKHLNKITFSKWNWGELSLFEVLPERSTIYCRKADSLWPIIMYSNKHIVCVTENSKY
jgi:hypothetical protein